MVNLALILLVVNYNLFLYLIKLILN